MKRPLTTNFSATPLKTADAPESEVSLPATWRETAPIVKAGPAVKAYRSAIRRHGQEAAVIGGSDAMEAVLRQVVEAAPDQAGREAALTEAWAGLPGWRT